MRPSLSCPRQTCAVCCARTSVITSRGATTRSFTTIQGRTRRTCPVPTPHRPDPRTLLSLSNSTATRPALRSPYRAASTIASNEATERHRSSQTKQETQHPSEDSTSSSSSNHEPQSQHTQAVSAPPFYTLFPQTLHHGAPPSGPFRIDLRALRREFLRLQATTHPDFHHAASASSSSTSRVAAEAASARLNEAYKTLSSPLLRAQYLLRELHAVDLAGDEAGAAGAVEPDVLGVVLEAREAIEEARREEDLVGLRRENEERIERAVDGLEKAFREGDVESAKREAVRLRYWVNIRESVDAWEEGKGVVLHH